MNIPFSVNGFPIGTVNLSISDSGNGIQLSNCEIIIDTSEDFGTSQLNMLMDALPIRTKLESLDPNEIDLIIEKLQEIKLGKV